MEGGSESDTVKLISSDGHQFIIDRRAALVSGTIKSMLSGPGRVFCQYFYTDYCFLFLP